MLPAPRSLLVPLVLTSALASGAHAGDSDLWGFLEPYRASSLPATDDASSSIPNNPTLSDRFYIGLGAFGATSTTQAELDSEGGVGATVNFEDALGLESTKVAPQLLARWRMSERWRLEIEHFTLNRSARRTLAADLEWGDQTISAGTSVDSTFDVSVTRLSAGYSFFKRPDKEIGVAFGLHLTDLDAEVSTTGGSGDDGKLLAPLPVFSLYGQFALTDEWAVNMRTDAFKLVIDPYDGKIISLGLDVTYQPWRYLGFGLGYRSLLIHMGIDESDWNGRLDSTFQGAIAFIYTSF